MDKKTWNGLTEIGRIILESFRVERDDYALGASKIFIRENLEAVLEKHRQDILEVEVLKLQRFVRGWYIFIYFLYLSGLPYLTLIGMRCGTFISLSFLDQILSGKFL